MTAPEVVFRVGAVRACIFCNWIERDGKRVPLRKVALEVRYRDGQGQWRSTKTLSANDIPKAITALTKAFDHIFNRSTAEQNK
jgi:hypothetical protein